MSLYLSILLGYSALMIALGVFVGRRVKTADGFFVAGRKLGPGLLFATMLAANIGGGSTVGATALGYRDGLAAWWWVGSAGIGSLVLAFWIGPRMRRAAAERGLHTVGDFLEQRFSPLVRDVVSLLLWVGTLSILAGQLIALSSLLTAVGGLSVWAGCVVGGVIIAVYFSAGGLLSSAYVNVLQLTVKLIGFALAVPFALSHAGGLLEVARRVPYEDGYRNFFHGGKSGWPLVALLGPAFFVSPGLLQKVFGARDDRTVRIGVGANAIGLLVFAIVPPMLGIIARSLYPALPNDQLALPLLLMRAVPVPIGAIGLAALFSAELSAADAVLFMLSTSVSQDLYRRVINKSASDSQVLRVARLSAIAGCAIAVGIAIVAQTIIGALSFFYSVLGVCLFVPIVGGLTVRRVGKLQAMSAIAGGVVAMLALQLATNGAGYRGISPALIGIVTSIICAALAAIFFRNRRGPKADVLAIK